MRPAVVISIGVATAVGLAASFVVPVRQSATWCDPVSGSFKRQAVWPFGITAGPRCDPSPLETRLRAIGYQWPQTWQFLGNDHYTLWGRPVEFECGTAPPIYPVASWLDRYAPAASPDELRRFADVMRSGSEAEQKAAVDAVTEKILASAEFGR